MKLYPIEKVNVLNTLLKTEFADKLSKMTPSFSGNQKLMHSFTHKQNVQIYFLPIPVTCKKAAVF